MTRKQLQFLISAGVFSASLLSGTVYADNKKTSDTPKTEASAEAGDKTVEASTGTPKTQDTKHATSAKKETGIHGCAGAGGCGGGK